MRFYECLPAWVASCVKGKDVREIRLRNNSAIKVNIGGQWYYCTNEGMTRVAERGKSLDISCDDIVKMACNNSIYAYEQMLAKGFFTLADGSRFGVAGCYSSGGVFQDYTSVCIRVPHCVDCHTEEVLSVVKSGNVLIVGPPGSGKTTLLRSIAKQLSTQHNVTVVDERGELDVCGELANCDVLKWTSKSVGFDMAVRCLSPDYIMCDELAQDDFVCISRATTCGVKVVATFHAGSFEDVKKQFEGLAKFKIAVICKSVGHYELVCIN